MTEPIDLAEARREVAIRIVQLKADIGSLGLFKTMHAMEEAVTAVGWEIAELEEREKASK